MATLINTDTNLPKVLEDEGRGMSNKFRSGENRFPCPPRWYFPREKQDKTLLFFFPVRKAGSSCWNSGQIPDLAVVLLQSPTPPPLCFSVKVPWKMYRKWEGRRERREKKRKTRGWNKIKESHRWPVTFYRVNVGSERERKRREGGREREEWRRKKMWKVRQAENYRDLFVRSHSNRADVGMSSCLFCRNSYKTVLISCRQ